MFISKTRLPHLLPPRAYYCADQYQSECNHVLMQAWHVIGTTNNLKRDGDFIACEVVGRPIQARVIDGELHVFSNICAHRHCLLTSKPYGNTTRMSCQYHGWEYGSDGKTRKIPEPKNFAPYPEQGERIPKFRIDTCGQIVWVCLSDTAPRLQDFLGKHYDMLAERFGDSSKEFLRLDVEYKSNWKVPIENSLEAYHVPSVHAKTFREDPGDERSTHIMNERSTAFTTSLPFSPHSRLDRSFQKIESTLMKFLGVETNGEYWQYHLFPNLLLSFTDAISLIHSINPTGPRTATGIIRQFGNMGNSRWGPRRWLAVAWGMFKGQISKAIMQEDLGLIPDIQCGLEKSEQEGVLGRCEERIHAFQQLIETETGNSNQNKIPTDHQTVINSTTSTDLDCGEKRNCAIQPDSSTAIDTETVSQTLATDEHND